MLKNTLYVEGCQLPQEHMHKQNHSDDDSFSFMLWPRYSTTAGHMNYEANAKCPIKVGVAKIIILSNC